MKKNIFKEINYDLTCFVRVYDKIFSNDLCEEIVEELKKENKWGKHTYYDYISNTKISYDNDLSVFKPLEANSYINSLNQGIQYYLKHYLKDIDVYWFTSITGFTYPEFHRYNSGEEMRIHCDHIQNMFDGERKGIPTLTILGCLNNNYSGGELILWEDVKIDLPAGSIIIFPSNFLYPHAVTPITNGTRYSYVSWVW